MAMDIIARGMAVNALKNSGGGPQIKKLSQLINDTGFINNTVNNLVNYYLKSDTYSKDEVDAIINSVSTISIDIVEELPTEGISATTIYLVANENDAYNQYLYINEEWKLIGSTTIDLSNYYNKSQVDNLLDDKQDNLTAGLGIDITGNVVSNTVAGIYNLEEYDLNAMDGTTEEFIEAVLDSNLPVGSMAIGVALFDDLPARLQQAEITVSYINYNTVNLELKSANRKPYAWFYNHWGFSHTGWCTYIENIEADNIAFDDSDTLQEKFDNGDFDSVKTISINGETYTQEDGNINLTPEFTALYQVTANLLASINATNADVTSINAELDEIDGQIEDINEELDAKDNLIQNLVDGQIDINATIDMYKQKVVRNGDATFAAADNTDYQWTAAQDSLVVTLPAITDMTRTHIINLNFIAGSIEPLTLFGDYNTPVDWEFTTGCLYQIQFKYIETAWEIRQYCPEREYVTKNYLENHYEEKREKINIEDDSSIAVQANKDYYGSVLTSLDITGYDNSNLETTISFSSGDTPTTLTFPEDILWKDGLEIIVKPNKAYLISILNGFFVWGEF